MNAKHALLMILCCAIPLILIFALPYVSLRGIGLILILLLCPLMHFLMMRGMHGKDKEHQGHFHYSQPRGDEEGAGGK